jgi:hypothetical protein
MQCFTFSESHHIAHLVLSRPESLNTMHWHGAGPGDFEYG